MSRKDWKTALSIAVPWAVINGLTYVIWGSKVQSLANIGVLAVLGLYVLIKNRRKYGRNA